jgi:hypothetical protein
MITTLKAATEIAWTLGNVSKMPGRSYGLPAAECNVGSKLRQVSGTPCEKCYAYLRGNYRYPSVVKGQYKRLDAIEHERWVEAMAFTINNAVRKGSEPFFRWHDSGDLQSLGHLLKICEVARLLPQVKFWLPTQEVGILKLFTKLGEQVPTNLVIRVSATKVDGLPTKMWPNTSTVHTTDEGHGYSCPARHQDNECKECRACWDNTVSNVSYHIH